MEAIAKPVLPTLWWNLRKTYIASVAIINFLIICSPSLYNSDFLVLLALGLLATLLITGGFASILCIINLVRQQWQRSLAWVLLAGLNFAGWWISYRISVVAMQLPLSPEDPALSGLLREALAPYFSL
jgi:hypothetical protein